jgi:hypothetical protein
MSAAPPEPEDEVESVRDALRAARRESPSDDSRRATLAALGLSPAAQKAALAASEPAPSRLGVLVRWIGVGLLVGLGVVIVLRWLA